MPVIAACADQHVCRVVADRDAALAALRVSEERFRGAFDAAAIGMALVGLDGRWVRVNPSLCRIVGYAERELLATTFQALTHPDDLDADLALAGRLVAGEIPNYSSHKRYVHRDGRVIRVLLTVSLARDAGGRPLHFVSQVQDVTDAERQAVLDADQRAVLERVAQDRPLREPLGLVAAMVERQVEGSWGSVLLLDDGEIEQVAPEVPPALVAAMKPRVYSIAAGLARRHADAGGRGPAVSDVAADPRWAGAARDAAAALGVRQCWAVPVRASDGPVLGLVAAYGRHDRVPSAAEADAMDTAARLAAVAAEHHQMTRRLAHLVRHDPLTGLPNRVCFEDRLRQALLAAQRSGRRFGLLVLDVDHFKRVNDTLGHDAGDALLQQFARRLAGQLRATDTLARMGGDEFMVVLPDLATSGGAAAVAAKLVACLAEPLRVGERALAVTSSVGVAVYPDDGLDGGSLQRHADEQMYLAKRRGRNGYAAVARPAA